MSMLRQPCPECGRTLELPADAVGRTAKCPACDAIFTIAQTAEVAGTAAAANLEPTPQTASIQTPAPSQPSYEANPFSSPLGTGSSIGSSQTSYANPYQPTHATPVAHVGELPIVPRSIEDIFTPTMSIFGARWAPLILSLFILLTAVLVVVVLPLTLLSALAQAGGGQAAGFVMLLAMPFLFFLSAYTWVGLTRVAIAVARNTPSPLGELLPPVKFVMRLIGGMIVIGLATFVAVALFLGILRGLAAAGAPQGILAAFGFLGIIIAIAYLIVIQWLLWPWIFVVSDGKASSIGSIRAAYAITMNNKLTSLLLIVIATALSMVGAAACYIGQLVTTPLTMLMFAVAYLLMTEQPIDDPKQLSQTCQPPPNQPTF